MNSIEKKALYDRVSRELRETDSLDVGRLRKEYGLEVNKLASDGAHVMILACGVAILINPEDQEAWDIVDKAIIDYRSGN